MEFRRNPRIYKPIEETINNVKKLPETPENMSRPIWLILIYPIFMILAYAVMLFMGITSTIMLILPVVMLIPMIMTPVISNKYDANRAKTKYKAEIKDYKSYINDLSNILRLYFEEISVYNKLNFPGVEEELRRWLSLDQTLWCKRAEHEDFASICLGTYSKQFPIQFKLDNEQAKLCKDEELKEKLYSVLRKYDKIDNAPLEIDMKKYPCIGIRNIDNYLSTNKFVSAILLSAIYSYGYDEYKLMALVNSEDNVPLAECKYQWIRWLPHCWDNDRKVRYFASTNKEKGQLLDELERICEWRSTCQHEVLPHITILVEDIDAFEKHSVKKYFNTSENKLNISIIFISDKKDIPSQCSSIIELGNKSRFINTKLFGMTAVEFSPRIIETYDIESLSRFLSDVELTDDSKSTDIPNSLSIYELHKEKNLTKESILRNWRENLCYRDGINIKLGLKSRNEEFSIDMSDAKDGSHALIAGTTGSGKSEFLQTFVLSTALRYSPNEVNFVFIDFKEGGMSEAFKNLPHTSGNLTNMEGETKYFAQRAITMLSIERKRRAKILRPYNQNINLYHKAYYESNDKSMEPLPHLFIIIDEFAEVISQCPEFKEMMDSLSRTGRGFGIHLILATQSPGQSVDSQIWTNSNCKICLRVLNDEESQAVLKSKDAAYITNRGRAICLTGSRNNLVEFQTAWSSAPTTDSITESNILIFDGIRDRIVLTKEEKKAYTGITQLKVLLEILNDIWNTKYNEHEIHTVLNQSMPTYLDISSTNINIHECKFYVGLGDFTNKHEQALVKFDYDGSNDHMIISGPQGSGRSNIINQMVKQMERYCDSNDIQFYIIQYGSKSLQNLQNSHIVAEYITNLVRDTSLVTEKIQRSIAFLKKKIYERQEENFDTNSEPHLVLVLDGWNQLNMLFENYSDDLVSLFTLGPAQFKVHIILITNTDAISIKLSPYFDTKLFMKYNASDYSLSDFTFSGTALSSKDRGVYLDTTIPYAVEIQSITDTNLPMMVEPKNSLIKIPTLNDCYALKGMVSRKLYEETKGRSILLGINIYTLEWESISFDFHGLLVSYCVDLPRNNLIQYIMDSFSNFNVELLVEESRSHIFDGNIVTYRNPDDLLNWANNIPDNSIIIIDSPGLPGDDCEDYANRKMFKWQEVLRDKLASNSIMLIIMEHTSRARNNSIFSDAVANYQKRIAIGGKGERHPFFGERMDTTSLYIKDDEALVSLESNSAFKVKLVN